MRKSLGYLLFGVSSVCVQFPWTSTIDVRAVPVVSDLGVLTNQASVNIYQTPVVAINNAGKGVATWLGNGSGLRLATYTARTDLWAATESLGDGTKCGYFPSANLSSTGDLIAGCVSSNTNSRSIWLK